ncbi:MAG TPA: class I SAM-dependent methyltransferase, partial [Chitinophagaceae bacterium]|nr:class I SAM-dependent methyltransferase [Chitinophagaceae bacterium]
MATSLPHDNIIPFQESAQSKKEQVELMFDDIAGKYDTLNRVLSARTDIGWRKKAISMLKKAKPASILDVATGTGDMAIMACKILNPEKITGIDISAGMLKVGLKKIEKEGIAEEDKAEHLEKIIPISTNHYLYLSGTPFRAISSGEFIEEQIFNWTY